MNDRRPLLFGVHFPGRCGGGVNMSTVFAEIESDVWEREILLTKGDGVCASPLLNATYELRIVLVEETATRTVFADFTPVR